MKTSAVVEILTPKKTAARRYLFYSLLPEMLNHTLSVNTSPRSTFEMLRGKISVWVTYQGNLFLRLIGIRPQEQYSKRSEDLIILL